MIELLIAWAFFMFSIAFVAFGEWLNSKFHWIDMTEENEFDHGSRRTSKDVKRSNRGMMK